MATDPFYPGLPQEVNDLIFEYVLGGTLRDANFTNSPDPAHLTVHSAWYKTLKRFHYLKFEYLSEPDIAPLWEFLRTLVQRPENRALVKHLTFSTIYLYRDFPVHQIHTVFSTIWNFGTHRFRARRVPAQDAILQPGQLTPQGANQIWQWLQVGYLNANNEIRDEFSQEIRQWYGQALYRQHRAWFEPAMRAVGFHKGPGDLFRNASRILNHGGHADGYQCPLVAMILAYCPNLVHLFIHVWHSEDDRFLDRVMNYATLRRGMWRSFAQLTPDDSKPPLAKTPLDGYQYPFVVDATKRPYWRLPSLVDFTGISVTGDDSLAHLNSPSRIRYPTLNTRIMFKLQLGSWLQWCTDLRALSIKIPADEFGSVSDLNENNGPKRIYPQTNTFDNWFDDKIPCCPPLATFTALRQLNIPVTILAGWQCIHEDGARFATHLPPSIKTLGIYTEDSNTLIEMMHPGVIYNELVGMVRSAAANGLACLAWDTSHAAVHTLPDEPMLVEAHRLNLYVENTEASDVLLCAGSETVAAWSITDRSIMSTIEKLEEQQRFTDVIPEGLQVHELRGQMRHVPNPTPTVPAPAPVPQAPPANDDDEMDIDK